MAAGQATETTRARRAAPNAGRTDDELVRLWNLNTAVGDYFLNGEQYAKPTDPPAFAKAFAGTHFEPLLAEPLFVEWLGGKAPAPVRLVERIKWLCHPLATTEEVLALERHDLTQAIARGDAGRVAQHRRNIAAYERQLRDEDAKDALLTGLDAKHVLLTLSEYRRTISDTERLALCGEASLYVAQRRMHVDPRLSRWRADLAAFRTLIADNQTAFGTVANVLAELANVEGTEIAQCVNPPPEWHTRHDETEATARLLGKLDAILAVRAGSLGTVSRGRPRLDDLAHVEAILSGRLAEAHGLERPRGALSFAELAELDLDGQRTARESRAKAAERVRTRVRAYVARLLKRLSPFDFDPTGHGGNSARNRGNKTRKREAKAAPKVRRDDAHASDPPAKARGRGPRRNARKNGPSRLSASGARKTKHARPR